METNLQQSESHVIDIIISTPEIQTTIRQTMQVELLNAVMNNKGDKLMEILTNEQNQAQAPQNQVQVAEPHLDEQGQDQPPQFQDQARDGEENQAQPQQDEQGQGQPPQIGVQASQGIGNQAQPHLEEQGRAPQQEENQAHHLEDEQGQAQLPQNMIQAPQREENQSQAHLEEQGQAQPPEIQGEDPPLKQGLPQQAPPRTSNLLQGVTSHGDGVLHIVARFELDDILNKICESWRDVVDVTLNNKRGETPLHCAAATGNGHIINKLISLAGEDKEKIKQLLRKQKYNGETCLHDAVRSGNLDAVKELVHTDITAVLGLRSNNDHALVKICDEEGVSPLYLATTLRHLEIVKYLCEERAQYPTASYDGPGRKTALHAAVLLDKDLSKHLANWNKELIDKADKSGSTPLHILASSNDKFTMKCFLELDESAGYHGDNEGSLPIHVAAANGSREIVRLLSDRRPNCCWSCNNLGQTILHIAVKNGNSDVVDYLCSKERPTGRGGQPPFQKSVHPGDRFAQIFNTRDIHGNTALHLAVLQGEQLIFCRLMQKKSLCLSFTNKKEQTPLDLAQLNLPRETSLLLTPRHWAMYVLVLAGADHGTCRSDHLATNVAKSDKEKQAKSIGKSAGLVAVCSVLILTSAFAAPFSVTKFYKTPMKDLAGAIAYRIFVMSDAMAFALSVVAISCSTLAGFSFTDRGTRFFYLTAAVVFLFLAALLIILVFTAGVFLAVGTVIDTWTVVVVCAAGVIFQFIALPMAPAFRMLLHAKALCHRLGFLAWLRALFWFLPRQRRERVRARHRRFCARGFIILFFIIIFSVVLFVAALESAQRLIQPT